MNLDSLDNSEEEFYNNAVNYWSEIPPTLDGMLGGFGFISQIDIKSSKMLLKQLFHSKEPPGRHYALDCGAGIGRITKFLLTEMFDKVDMVEQNGAFLEQAKKYLGPKISKLGSFYPKGLQDFQPELGKYDVIWVQWVLGHLTNNDLIQFLVSCRNGLKENGVIIIKENVTATDEIEKDEQDSSVTRPLRHYHIIFQKAKLHCYRQTKQQNFPKGLFPVYMFVLKPNDDSDYEQDNNLKSKFTTTHETENQMPKNCIKVESGNSENTEDFNLTIENNTQHITEVSNHIQNEILESNNVKPESICASKENE